MVRKTGDTITGAQPKSITATGKYGEKAVIGTAATQTVSTGRLETAIGGTVAGLTVVGGAIGSDYAANAYKDLKRGDYVDAARNSVGAVLEGLSKLDITGLGHGVNDFLNKTGLSGSRNSAAANSNSQQSAAAQRQAETRGDLAGAAAANAAAQAAQKKRRSRHFGQRACRSLTQQRRHIQPAFFAPYRHQKGFTDSGFCQSLGRFSAGGQGRVAGCFGLG